MDNDRVYCSSSVMEHMGSHKLHKGKSQQTIVSHNKSQPTIVSHNKSQPAIVSHYKSQASIVSQSPSLYVITWISHSANTLSVKSPVAYGMTTYVTVHDCHLSQGNYIKLQVQTQVDAIFVIVSYDIITLHGAYMISGIV